MEHTSLYRPSDGSYRDDTGSDLHRKFKCANIPRDGWNSKRDSTLKTRDNSELYEAIVSYIEGEDWLRDPGRGFTVIGPSKSGKSHLICAILRCIIKEDRTLTMTRDYSECVRIDYQELTCLARSEFTSGLSDTLRESQVLFLDNIYGLHPAPPILAAMEYRRDQRKTTFLGFLADDLPGVGNCERVYMIFSDINKTFLLKENVLPHLNKRQPPDG
jgi:hypothetical protein